MQAPHFSAQTCGFSDPIDASTSNYETGPMDHKVCVARPVTSKSGAQDSLTHH